MGNSISKTIFTSVIAGFIVWGVTSYLSSTYRTPKKPKGMLA